MDISTRKMALIQWLINLQDDGMIRHLERLSGNEADHALAPAEKEGLEHALLQVQNGETITGEEVHARLKSKYGL